MSLQQEIENRAGQAPAGTTAASRLWVWSARSPEVLDEMTANLAKFLTIRPDLELDDVAFTLQMGRQHFDHRRSLTCRNRQEALTALLGDFPLCQPKRRRPDLVFLFADPSGLDLAALSTLYRTDFTYRAELDRIASNWDSALGIDPVSLLKGTDLDTLTSPARLATVAACAKLWLSWGIVPHIMVGQGLGLVICALLAETIQLRTALHLAAAWNQDALAATHVTVAPPRIPFISPLTGQPTTHAEYSDPEYWRRDKQDSPPVTYQPKADAVLLGFGSVANFASESAGPIVPALVTGTDPVHALHNSLGALYWAGIDPDWRAFRADRAGRRTPLPGYPFKRERYWFTPKPVRAETFVQQKSMGDMDAFINSLPEEKLDEMIALYENALGQNVQPAQKARPNSLEETLLELCCDLLGGVDMGIEDNITLFGADSMFTMQLSKKLAELYHVELSAHHLFVEPTVVSLAQTLRRYGVVAP